MPLLRLGCLSLFYLGCFGVILLLWGKGQEVSDLLFRFYIQLSVTFVVLKIVHCTMFMEESDTWALDRIDGKGHVSSESQKGDPTTV